MGAAVGQQEGTPEDEAGFPFALHLDVTAGDPLLATEDRHVEADDVGTPEGALDLSIRLGVVEVVAIEISRGGTAEDTVQAAHFEKVAVED